VGYIIAPAAVTGPIRKMHDFMTVGAPAPLQEAGAVALRLPDSYYGELAAHYTARRDRLFGVLKMAGLEPFNPMGAYYIMCNIAPLRERFGLPNDVEFTRFLVTEIGVAAVPGSSFFRDASAGKNLIRFTFCKKEETLEAAAERLSKLSLQPAVAKQNQA
jgi:aminotransferase